MGSVMKPEIRKPLKSSELTAIVLVTVVLCFVMNVAIFAVINSTLMRHLPIPTPDQLVTLFNASPKTGFERDAGDKPKT